MTRTPVTRTPGINTVADLVAALQQLPQNLPVLAGTHYDNDVALRTKVDVRVSDVEHIEAEYFIWTDPSGNPSAFKAVTIS